MTTAMRAGLFAFGVVALLIGAVLFGATFDLIDATRAWRYPAWIVMPAILLCAMLTSVPVLLGLGGIAAAFSSAQGTTTQRETSGSVGEADGGPVPQGCAQPPSGDSK